MNAGDIHYNRLTGRNRSQFSHAGREKMRASWLHNFKIQTSTEVKKPRGDQKWSLLFGKGFKKIDTLAVIEGSFVDEIGREIIIEEKKREQ